MVALLLAVFILICRINGRQPGDEMLRANEIEAREEGKNNRQ
jgi:hypothetical protein